MAKAKPKPKGVRKPALRKTTTKKSQTLAKQSAFLAAYSETANIRIAAQVAKIDRSRHYAWLECDESYRERFEVAKEESIEVLEAEARRRAVDGVEKPTGWYQGVAGGTVREYSDTLLIFLLKGVAPEKYRERIDSKHSGGVSVTGEVRVYLPDNARPDGVDA